MNRPAVTSTSEPLAHKAQPQPMVKETIEAVVVAVLLALFIKEFGVQAFKIPTGSMKQTLLIGDHLLVNKFRYGIKIPFTNRFLVEFDDPERGDIIVFQYPKDPNRDFIKRVIGVPGSRISINKKRVYINGELLDEPYTQFITPRYSGQNDFIEEFTVPEDQYFVMGDNRDNSQDSRFWGFVPRGAIKGKAFMIYYSWDQSVQRNWGALTKMPLVSRVCFNGAVRWDRIGRIVR